MSKEKNPDLVVQNMNDIYTVEIYSSDNRDMIDLLRELITQAAKSRGGNFR